jgi:hypothetical protein
MKYLIILLSGIAALIYIDRKYNAELERHYAETKEIMQTYCVPSAVLHHLKR